jgi:hypothetical protein
MESIELYSTSGVERLLIQDLLVFWGRNLLRGSYVRTHCTYCSLLIVLPYLGTTSTVLEY